MKDQEDFDSSDCVTSGSANAELAVITLRSTFYTRFTKPFTDRLTALIALIVLALPLLLTAVLVAVALGRPVLFCQRRVGLNGKVFTVLKFRTMLPDRREEAVSVALDSRLTHKTDKDPRHTLVGRWLRRYSLDELPQFINVLLGEMSLVGPRPELESVVAACYTARFKQRHLVKPGLTGLWQISARGREPMHENGEWDLDYVERISLLTDLAILVKTPFVMFRRNAGT